METTGYDAPNYTQTPNPLFDEHMRDMTEVELKVVMAAVRKTFGYHRDSDAISLTQFEEITGLSRQGVLDGIDRAMKRGVLCHAGNGRRGVAVYSLNLRSTGQQNRPVQIVDQSKSLTRTGQQNRPELVNKIDTQKKVVKETTKKKKDSANAGSSPSKPEKKSSSKKGTGRQPDPLFDAVAEQFFLAKPEDKSAVAAVAGRVGKLVAFLKGRAAANPDGINRFTGWYARVHSDLTLPKDAAKFATAWLEFEASPDAAPVAPAPTPVPAVPPSAPPLAPIALASQNPHWVRDVMEAATAAGENPMEAAVNAMLERKTGKKVTHE